MRGFSTARGWLLACAALALGAWAGGAIAQGTLPASTAKLYPDEPSSSVVEGSKGRAVAKRKIQALFEDLFAAAHKVALQKGLEVDHQDRDVGKLSGKGYWQSTCGGQPCKMPVTFAAYFEPADCDAKEWDLTFVLDRHGVQAGEGEDRIAQSFVTDMQKVIWAQR